MFTKADPDNYQVLLSGISMKSLAHGVRTQLTRFKLDREAVIPVHQHPHEQTGYLVSGALRFTLGQEEFMAQEGDSWNIPAEVPHGAIALQDSIVIEVFSPPREDYLPQET